MILLGSFLAACSTPSAQPFTCANAASQLGHPNATVEGCDPAPHLPEILQVALKGGDLQKTTIIAVHLADGKRDPSTGNAALATFLDGLGARRDALTMPDMIAVLRAFNSFPKGIDGSSSMFDMPNVGKSSFVATPFVLELYNGDPPNPGFFRDRLAGPPWTWTHGTLADGATTWQDGPATPLR